MKRISQFLQENVVENLMIPMTISPHGRSFVRFEEKDPSAAVKYFDLFIPSGSQADFFVFRLPSNLEFKKIFPEYNYSCDFLLFHFLKRIVMLVELKGADLPCAKKQIKYSIPFVNYLFKLFEIEENITCKYRIKRLIVSYNKRRSRHTNLGNDYKKNHDGEYTILQVPSSQSFYEWKDLI